MEEWRDIEGYEGLYQVSNEGNVRSLKTEEVIMNPVRQESGHLFVYFYKNGIGEPHYVHRLVAQAFIPNHNNYDVVHHKNENPEDNRVENLEWTSRGRHNEIHKSKTVYQYTLDGELVAIYESARDAARKLSLNFSAIGHCCNGGFYRNGKWVNFKLYKGYKWSFEPL